MSHITDLYPDEESREALKKVMAAFGFDEEDLLFNRQGKLSEKQKKRLRFTGRAVLVGSILITLLFSLVFLLNTEGSLSRKSLLSLTFIVAVPLGFGLFMFWLTNRAYQQGIVKHATGTMSFKPSGKFRVLCIGDECFRCNVETNKLLEEGVIYRVYYTPADQTILSIERVR